MVKITPENIERIRSLYSEGKNQEEIATIFNVSQKTISYWLLPEEKRKEVIRKSIEWFKKLPIETRREVYKRRKPYIIKYIKKKYHSNEIFRENEKKRVTAYHKREKK